MNNSIQQIFFNNLSDIENHVKKLLKKDYEIYGNTVNLYQRGWKFAWDMRSVKKLGCCRPNRKIITLSRKVWINNLGLTFKIQDTILHEIAHAIQFEIEGKSNHGTRWKNIAMSIGCKGNRVFNGNGNYKQPKTKYSLVCPFCSNTSNYVRKPKRNRSCAVCHPGSYNKKFKMELKENY